MQVKWFYFTGKIIQEIPPLEIGGARQRKEKTQPVLDELKKA
jgi:hypothetical protein